jgi:hypothetical protein
MRRLAFIATLRATFWRDLAVLAFAVFYLFLYLDRPHLLAASVGQRSRA